MHNTSPQYVVGIDEAGRGPLAGPVAVGAVMAHVARIPKLRLIFQNVKDSKKLSPGKRELWYRRLKDARRNELLDFKVSFIGVGTIDKKGISFAVHKGIARTLKRLSCPAEESFVLLDGGIRAPSAFTMQETIVRGDEKEMLIALASIAAKVLRDRYMLRAALWYPHYGFDLHKGYGTDIHYRMIRKYGLSEVHRISFLRKIYR